MNSLYLRLAQAAVCGLVMGATIVGSGQLLKPTVAHSSSPEIADMVKTKALVIVDQQDRQRGSFYCNPDGSVNITLQGATGAGSADMMLSCGSNGDASMTFYGKEGPRFLLSSVQEQSGPSLYLHDAHGKDRFTISLADDGEPVIIKRDANEQVTWMAP